MVAMPKPRRLLQDARRRSYVHAKTTPPLAANPWLVAGTGHWSVEDQPDELTEILRIGWVAPNDFAGTVKITYKVDEDTTVTVLHVAGAAALLAISDPGSTVNHGTITLPVSMTLDGGQDIDGDGIEIETDASITIGLMGWSLENKERMVEADEHRRRRPTASAEDSRSSRPD